MGTYNLQTYCPTTFMKRLRTNVFYFPKGFVFVHVRGKIFAAIKDFYANLADIF